MRKLVLILSVLYFTSLQASMKNYRFHEDDCEPVTKHFRTIGNFYPDPINQQLIEDNSSPICILSMDPVIDQLFKFGIRGIHKINRKYFLMGTGYDASQATKKGFPTEWRPSRILNSYKALNLRYDYKTMTYLRGPHHKVNISADIPTYILSSMVSTCTDIPEQDWHYLSAMNVSHFHVKEINFISTLEKSQHFASKLSQSRVQRVSFEPDTFGQDYMECIFNRLSRLFEFIKAAPGYTLNTLDINVSFLPIPDYIDRLINQVLSSSIKKTHLKSSTLCTSQITKIFRTVSQAWSDSTPVSKTDDQQPIHINIVNFSEHSQNTGLKKLYVNEFTHIVYLRKPFKILKQFTYRSDSKLINSIDILKMCFQHIRQGWVQKLYHKNCIADKFLGIMAQYFNSDDWPVEDLNAFKQNDHVTPNISVKVNPMRSTHNIKNSDKVYLNFVNN